MSMKCQFSFFFQNLFMVTKRGMKKMMLVLDLPFVCFTVSLVLREAKRPLWWPHLNVRELKFGRSTLDVLADVPPCQSSIDTLHTITPNVANLPPSIEHRCLEYYSKLGRSAGRTTPCQLSIDALNAITPNLADLLAELPPTIAMYHGIYIMGCIW